jgi:hypothetical protein
MNIYNHKREYLGCPIKILFLFSLLIFSSVCNNAQSEEMSKGKTILPMVEFPQFGIDDPAVYSGYVTRFYKDIKGNTTQVTIDSKNKRVTNLFADAANESVSFSWRNSRNENNDLKFASPKARVAEEGNFRTVEYTFSTSSSSINLGLFLLSTMRVERDFRYKERYSLPLNTEPVFEITEFKNMIESLSRLPENIRNEHLALLNAASIDQVKQRLSPEIRLSKRNEFAEVTIQQVSLDGKNHLCLEIKVDTNRAEITNHGNYLILSSRNNKPIEFSVKMGTDSKALSPLSAKEIFNKSFWSYYRSKKNENDSLTALSKKNPTDEKALTNFRKLERQIKSIELLSSKEKLMAGLPNFATYFGRDMMMTALMMKPIWSPQMLEYVISSVIKKLRPDGNVSHEEGLAIQAIRENANEYNALAVALLDASKLGKNEKVLEINGRLKHLLANLQETTENYHMIDDDFMLPILTAHLLTTDQLSRQEKIEYLLSYNDEHFRMINLLVKNFNYVLKLADPYASDSKAVNLVGFEKLEKNKWRSSSWRDSQTGYANGRFAMDVNAIFVPKALEALSMFIDFLNNAGVNSDSLRKIVPEIQKTILDRYINEPSLLKNAVKVWHNSLKHFQVTLTKEEALNKIKDKLDGLNNDEKEYWKKILKNFRWTDSKINFIALSLDSVGRPIPVVNTDPAMFLFLENFTQKILEKKEKPETIYNLIKMFTTRYPLGLFIHGVGPVVSNDAYSLPDVWEGFKLDAYHSPHTVWGREVNLFILGISSQILNAYDTRGKLKSSALKEYVYVLRESLDKIVSAVEKSGLKESELWSYKISNGKIEAWRYSTASDIQLWNLTDLAAQFLLNQVSNVKRQ